MKDAKDYADSYMATIRDMVAALDVDYDRLKELREEKAAYDADEATRLCWAEEYSNDAEELLELEDAAQGSESIEGAEYAILADALSVETRSDWELAGNSLSPSEYRILLTTGGPHLEIRGELDRHGEPCRAWLVYSDWGTPYTERINQECDEEALLTYSRCFYFGE